MKLKAKLREDKVTGIWAADFFALGLSVQGRTSDEALMGLYEAIMYVAPGLSFEISMCSEKQGRVYLETHDEELVIDTITRQGRGP
jgi:hypothetical protein